jgi:hypothetical protein
MVPFVSQRDVERTPDAHGDVLTANSDGIVALLKELLWPRADSREVLLRG